MYKEGKTWQEKMKLSHPTLPVDLDEKQNIVWLENVEFNRKFKIFAHTQQEVFYVLTPQMMERILKIYERFDDMCISIMGSRMILAINSSLNGLEPQLKKRVEYEAERRRLLEELQEIVDVIEGLELEKK